MHNFVQLLVCDVISLLCFFVCMCGCLLGFVPPQAVMLRMTGITSKPHRGLLLYFIRQFISECFCSGDWKVTQGFVFVTAVPGAGEPLIYCIVISYIVEVESSKHCRACLLHNIGFRWYFCDIVLLIGKSDKAACQGPGSKSPFHYFPTQYFSMSILYRHICQYNRWEWFLVHVVKKS